WRSFKFEGLMTFRSWIDNDACPRRSRELVFKAGKRVSVPIKVVANSYMHPPRGVDVEMVVRDRGFDAADDYMANNIQPDDLVITEDVPLAARVIEGGGVALSPHGRMFDAESIQEQLAMRNLRQELRSAGEIRGGPSEFGAADINKFAAAFDRWLAARI